MSLSDIWSPLESAKRVFSDELLEEWLNSITSDFPEVVNTALFFDGYALLSLAPSYASLLQHLIEEEELHCLDDKADSENTLRDYIFLVIQFAHASDYLINLVRRYYRAKGNLNRKGRYIYLDNLPDIR